MAEMDVTVSDFGDKVINSDIPVLVDFWARWCGPCKMLGPVISQIAEEYEGKIKVAKVDVDQNGDVALQYGVESIPAIKLFKEGKVVAEFMGFKPLPAVKQWLDPLL